MERVSWRRSAGWSKRSPQFSGGMLKNGCREEGWEPESERSPVTEHAKHTTIAY